jgi:carboxymethylenebutenolidase
MLTPITKATIYSTYLTTDKFQNLIMDQQIIDLYDEYTHKPLNREDFLKRLAQITGSMAVAMSVLPALEGCYTRPATSANANDLVTERITYPGAAGDMEAYAARPNNKKKLGVVVVIHENRGLKPHIEDVARRVATAGYLAIAPDALSPLGVRLQTKTRLVNCLVN